VRLGVGVGDAGRLAVAPGLDSAGAVVVEVAGGAAGWPHPASSKARKNAAEIATPDVADLRMSPSKGR
jgi:hypothetical protein